MLQVPRRLANVLVVAIVAASLSAQELRRTYAIRVGDKIVGYQIEAETPRDDGDVKAIEFHVRSLARLEVLGHAVDQQVEQRWTLDAATRAVRRVHSSMAAGEQRVLVTGELGDKGFTYSVAGGAEAVASTIDPAVVVIAPDVRWLLERGPRQPGAKAEIEWFTPEYGGVSKVRIALRAAARELTVLGEAVRAPEWTIEVAAMQLEFHVCVAADGSVLRYELPALGMVVERAAPAVIDRIERFDLTHTILGKTNLDLEDPSPLTYLKVRVVADTARDATAAQLTHGGQRFTGTVENGRVDGVFEIRTGRSDGAGSLPFPVPAGAVPAELRRYLEKGEGVDLGDDAVAALAKELAAGAPTGFEVLRRFATWVGTNIRYDIPGGITAAKTLALRAGDCGGHSQLLAAMLRSVGIPARTPMGAMYVPLDGGSFGQHMWNEVWLGSEIGWLAVDSTAKQATFVDASHIRLAEGAAPFRPQTLEVLEWEPKPAAGPVAAARRTGAWPWQVGDSWAYSWRRGDKEIGVETTKYVGVADGGHEFSSRLDLADGKFVETVRYIVGDDGRARSMHVARQLGGAETEFDLQCADGKATVTIGGAAAGTVAAIDVDPTAFALHNTNVTAFALIAARLGPIADGAESKVQLVHDETRRVYDLRLRGGAATSVDVGGDARATQRLVAKLADQVFDLDIDAQGRLLRWHQHAGDLVVVLKP